MESGVYFSIIHVLQIPKIFVQNCMIYTFFRANLTYKLVMTIAANRNRKTFNDFRLQKNLQNVC